MIPEDRFSTTTFKGQLYNPWSRRADISLHWGPIAIQDPSQGLGVRLWKARTLNDAQVWLSAPGVTESSWYTHTTLIEELSLAFDQNGRPCISFTDSDGLSFLRWFDPVPNEIVNMPVTGVTPRVTLDDNRPFNGANSDVILGYVRDGIVRFRQQRDRFTVEYTPPIGVGGSPASATGLRHISMNSKLRLEFLTDGAGDEPWVLAEVVADLLNKSGLQPDHVDVRELYEPLVEGLRVANEGDAASAIATLQQAYFFDPAAWDKKLRFVMRGGDPVASITFDDLLEKDNDRPLSIERVQERELLRKVNVTMVDSTAGWIPNKQTAERRSATIKAIGESSTVIPITAQPDFIATVAMKRLRVPWGEPNKFTYSLGIPHSALTPTDVITLEDRRGRVFRMRLSQNDEDYGKLAFEANSDASWLYKQVAVGAVAPPSIPTVPGQVGDTIVFVVDIPVMRDQDDELGYYMAVYGTGNGWNGGVVEISLDGGATVAQSITIDTPVAAGVTVSALLPEESSEYLSNQVLRVAMSEQPESVTRDDILRYRNLMAVERSDGGWEVMQYQTVTPVSDGVYDLSGLVRGRYSTEPLTVDVGDKLVLIDNALIFVQLQQWMVGQTISYRGISVGQNPDDVVWESFVDASPMSQTEWPVHYVRATRDSGDVTVEWIGRGRLGVEISPRNSKYFTGYRVIYSDGYTADTTAMTHTRTSTPAGVTITVAAINSITGLGPQSEGITI